MTATIAMTEITPFLVTFLQSSSEGELILGTLLLVVDQVVFPYFSSLQLIKSTNI